jgi:hypothetical protein
MYQGSEKYWNDLIKEWQESGLNKTEFSKLKKDKHWGFQRANSKTRTLQPFQSSVEK